MSILILLVRHGALWVLCAWCTAGCALIVAKVFGRDVPPIVRGVFHEVRPFYWPLLIAWALAVTWEEGFRWSTSLSVAIFAWNWWSLRNVDDDDRWKRRRRRAADKVTEVAGRLTVVPATAGAR